MFVNEGALKKVIKAGYKNMGLTIGCREEDYVLAGAGWCLQIDRNNLTNKIKGLMVEIAGGLPEEGEWATYMDEKEPQLQIKDAYGNLREASGGDFWKGTRMLYVAKNEVVNRVWKREDDKACILLPECLAALAFEGKIENETLPEGPYGNGSSLYWRNDKAVLAVYVTKPDEEADVFLAAIEKAGI